MAGIHYRPGIEAAPGYRLISLLGRGGFGEVWKAEGPGRVTVAVKIIDKVDEKAGRKEFRALKLIKDLRHPNLVSIAGFWLRDADGNSLDPDTLSEDASETAAKPSELIIAMDMGEMSLLDRLEECRTGTPADAKGGIPLEELLEYMDAAARAIDYLNTRHDIQHRDIKPQNILIVGGSAQVCDFGLASTVSAVRTSMGGAGSLAYMAPEVYTSKRPSRSTDQYGLAVAYIELRTGRLPLSDVESYSILDDAKRKGMLDLSWVEDAERPVLAKATALNPEDRYLRCVDFVRALRQSVGAGAIGTRTSEAAKPIGDYLPERQLYRRGGDEVWEATGPEGHRVFLVIRDMAEAQESLDRHALGIVREISKSHRHLAEMYEFVRINAEGKTLPARLYEGPNPPPFAKLLLAGRLLKENLSERMTGGGIPPARLLGYLRQMAEAVDFLNEPRHELAGRKVALVHRNLRPVNFQVEDDQIYVGNFASVHTLDGDEQDFPAGQKLQEGPFLPPEVAQGKLTRWSDQFMLAVSYLQMRTGKPSSGLSSSAGSSAESPSPKHHLDLADLREEEQAIVAKATSTNPRQRYRTCLEMVQALEDAWSQITAREKPKTPAPDTAGPSASQSGAATMMPPGAAAHGGGTSAAYGGDSRRTEVFVEPAPDEAHYRGTLAAPMLGETRIPGETDRAELDVPDETDARHAHRPNRPAAAPRPTPAKPSAARQAAAAVPIWQRPIAVGGAIAALSACVLAAYLVGNRGEENSPSPGGNDSSEDIDNDALAKTVSSYLLKGKFDDAFDAIERDAVTDAQRKQQSRDKVRLAWFEQNITPLTKKFQYTQAFDALGKAPARLVAAKQRESWENELSQRWYAYATKLSELKKYAEATAQYNELLQRKGSYYDSVRLRAEALDGLLSTAVGKLDDDPIVAHELLSGAIAGIEGGKELPNVDRAADALKKKRALLERARANIRRDELDRVKADLALLTAPFDAPKDQAHQAVLRLLVDKGTISLSEAERVRKDHASDMDRWESAALDKLVVGLTAESKGVSYARFQESVKAADGHVKGRKFSEARQVLKTIADNAELRKIAESSGKGDFDELQALVLLGDKSSTAAEVAAGVAAAQSRIAAATPSAGRMVDLCRALATRALEPAAPNSPDRKNPALLAAAIPVVAQAKAKAANAASRSDISAILQSLAGEATADVRRMRDAIADRQSADKNKSFVKLRAACEDAARLGIANRVTQASLAESLVETADSSSKLADVVKELLAPKTPAGAPSPTDATPADERYLQYVLAIGQAANKDEQPAASHLLDAWKGQIAGLDPLPAPQVAWQLAPLRRRRAIELLVKAGERAKTGLDHDPKLGADPDGNGDVYNPVAAAKAYSMFALAANLLVGTPFDAKTARDAETIATTRLNHILTAAYSKGREDLGLKLTDEFIEAAGDKIASTQVLVVNARLHERALAKDPKQIAHRNAAILAYGRLLALCESKGVGADVVYGRVIEPGCRLAEALDPNDKSPPSTTKDLAAKDAAARLFATRGRYIRLFPATEDQFASEASGAEKLAYESYGKAIALVGDNLDYFVGRALATHSRWDIKHDDIAKSLFDDSQKVAELAKTDVQKNTARGLKGMALLHDAIWEPRNDKKTKKLGDALTELDAARDGADKQSDDYPTYLLAAGDAHLQWASCYIPGAERKTHLTAAVAVAKFLDEQYQERRRPDVAYKLWGNAEEDHGFLLEGADKDLKGFDRAAEMFSKQYEAARAQNEPKGDPKSMSNALMNRGRCRFRNALALLDRSVAKKDATDEEKKQAEALALKKLREAQDDLKEAIQVAEKLPLNLDQSHRWLGEIYQHRLVDDREQATEHIRIAAELAKSKNQTWPDYELRRAKNSLYFAKKHADPRRFEKPMVEKHRKEASDVAQLLTTSKDDRITSRHRIAAAQIEVLGNLYLRNPEDAQAVYDKAAAAHQGEDAFMLSLATAEAVLDLPGAKPRRLDAKEIQLAQRTLQSALTLSKDLPPERKRMLFLLNLRYSDYWSSFFGPMFDEYKRTEKAPTGMADAARNIIFHLDQIVRLAPDPQWDPLEPKRPTTYWSKNLEGYKTLLGRIEGS